MLKLILPVITLIWSTATVGQIKNNEIETILLNFLTESYENQQVKISEELERLEKYLIESKYLKSSSGQSYYDFLNEVAEKHDKMVLLDDTKFKNICKLKPNEFYGKDCLTKLKAGNPSVTANSTVYNELRNEYAISQFKKPFAELTKACRTA